MVHVGGGVDGGVLMGRRGREHLNDHSFQFRKYRRYDESSELFSIEILALRKVLLKGNCDIKLVAYMGY